MNQRGFVSGWISAPQAVGTILGILLVTTIWASTAAEQAFGYPFVAILLIVLAIPFILTLPDQVLRKDQRPRGGLGTMLQASGSIPSSTPTSAGRCSAASWSTSATRSERRCCCTFCSMGCTRRRWMPRTAC
ncbi:MAG: hypothetical protein WDM88_00905 [Galbitalea sp.]